MFCMSLLTADFQHLHVGIENLMRLFQREGGFLRNCKCCVRTRSRLRCSAEVFGVKKTKNSLGHLRDEKRQKSSGSSCLLKVGQRPGVFKETRLFQSDTAPTLKPQGC